MAIDNPAPSLESVILNTLTEWLPVLTGIVVGLLFGLIWYSVKTKPTGPSPYPPVINHGHFSVDSPSPTSPVTNHGHPSVNCAEAYTDQHVYHPPASAPYPTPHPTSHLPPCPPYNTTSPLPLYPLPPSPPLGVRKYWCEGSEVRFPG